MYSRYFPGPDGTHRRERVVSEIRAPVTAEAPPVLDPPVVPAAAAKQSLKRQLSARLPAKMELGDLLVLLIALLLLIDADEDLQTILITAAAFFLL